MNLQPTLHHALVNVRPLETSDWDRLFAAASDPMIWKQHPNPNRYRQEDFETYFRGAMESKGALLVLSPSGEVIGCSRYYQLDLASRSVLIGYTFLVCSHWGGKTNPALKYLMLNHAFQSVDRVLFHVGAENRRSQVAMERLGGVNVRAFEVAYFGEPAKLNIEYEIDKQAFATATHTP
jgi:N-acetyltransferase